MSDGINILFGEGPFGKLRDRVSVRSVSLSNWRLNSGTGKSLRGACIALKGQNEIAQGNALGKWPNKTLSPERAKGFGR